MTLRRGSAERRATTEMSAHYLDKRLTLRTSLLEQGFSEAWSEYVLMGTSPQNIDEVMRACAPLDIECTVREGAD